MRAHLIYQTLKHEIDIQGLTVKNSDNVNLNIRPKTCQLLIFLLENSGKPINKQTLLESVWSGAIVGEQVIFQSINEIRQLFPNNEVIKTIPQKGYVWLPDVQIKETKKPFARNKKTTLLALCMLALLFASIMLNRHQPDASNDVQLAQQNISGSIVILPTQNQIEGNDHSWIRLGMMDQIIKRLPNSNDHLVLQADYVLEVLKRANASSKELLSKDIQQIFRVSGAELIVFSKLSGVPHDYQLSYVFNYRKRLKKGVLLNKNLQLLIDEFSLLIAKQLGDEILPLEIAYQADFNNALLSSAIDKHLEGNFQLANPILETIVLNNPENLTAQRILVGNLFRLKLFKQAAERIDIALPIAQKLKDKDEITRLLYSKALYHYVTYNDSKSADVAVKALITAKENNDWLLMAHIKDIQGNLAVNKENYELAEAFYNEGKQYHQVLHCPVGESQSWANLASLAKIQNQQKKFTAAIDQAINIATTRELSSQLNYFKRIKEQGFN
jgi:DNA-binding winged helix-turn-helix (wHTH) protein